RWERTEKRTPARRRVRASADCGRRSGEAPLLLQSFGEKQQANHEQQHAKGNGGAQRPVVGGAEQADDDVGNHNAAGTAQQQRGEEVAQAKDESKSGAGKNAGNGERQDYPPESLQRGSAQVMRGFHQVAGNVLQGGVDGQKSKWRVDVSEREHHRERAVEEEFDGMPCEVRILQQSIEHTITSQNGFPCVSADQVANPQGDDYQLVKQILASAGVK